VSAELSQLLKLKNLIKLITNSSRLKTFAIIKTIETAQNFNENPKSREQSESHWHCTQIAYHSFSASAQKKLFPLDIRLGCCFTHAKRTSELELWKKAAILR
jgi:hypothetical protein